jgi:hypothetical protein
MAVSQFFEVSKMIGAILIDGGETGAGVKENEFSRVTATPTRSL